MLLFYRLSIWLAAIRFVLPIWCRSNEKRIIWLWFDTHCRQCSLLQFNCVWLLVSIKATPKKSNQWFFRTICAREKKNDTLICTNTKRESPSGHRALVVISGWMKKKELWLWRKKKANSVFHCCVCITAKSSMAHKPTDITAIRIGLIVHFVLSPLLSIPFIHLVGFCWFHRILSPLDMFWIQIPWLLNFQPFDSSNKEACSGP